MCLDECTLRRPRENVGSHPYVRKLIGCHHGKLFSEPCTECEIVGLREEYARAVKTVMRVRDRLRVLGVGTMEDATCKN